MYHMFLHRIVQPEEENQQKGSLLTSITNKVHKNDARSWGAATSVGNTGGDHGDKMMVNISVSSIRE
jgi:hypothetical protein